MDMDAEHIKAHQDRLNQIDEEMRQLEVDRKNSELELQNAIKEVNCSNQYGSDVRRLLNTRDQTEKLVDLLEERKICISLKAAYEEHQKSSFGK